MALVPPLLSKSSHSAGATFSEDAQMRVGKQLETAKQIWTADNRQAKKRVKLLSLVGFLWRGSWSRWKDDDDRDQWSWSQVHVTAILGTDWTMLRTQIIQATSQVREREGIGSHTCTGHMIRKRTVNVTHNWLGPVFYTSLLTIHVAGFLTLHILFILYLHIVTGEDAKSEVSYIPATH